MERTNRNVLEILCHFDGQFQETWVNCLPHFPDSINSSVNYSTDKAPHCICLMMHFCSLFSYSITLKTLLKLSCTLSRPFMTVSDKLQTSREEVICKQHGQIRPITVSVGHPVMKNFSAIAECRKIVHIVC